MNLAHQGLCPHEYDPAKLKGLVLKGSREFLEFLAGAYPEAKKDPGLPVGEYLALEKSLQRTAEAWVYINVILPQKGGNPTPCASNPKAGSPSSSSEASKSPT